MTQAQALNIMKTGVNVYLTGSAGSGKTYVLKKYVEWLNEHDIVVAVTASTGIAATHMNGQTIHGWAGIGIKESFDEYDLEQLEQKQYLWKRFEKTKVLIIDEISMLHAHRLDMVERVCRRFKRNDLPFGGMQIILSGDFFQLPPIRKAGARSAPAQNLFSETTLDFETGEEISNVPDSDLIIYSSAWKKMKPAICYLTEQHRQDDKEFLEILNAIRENRISAKHLSLINSRINANVSSMIPTKLYTHNVDVDSINYAELAKIKGDEKEFIMSGKGSDVLIDILKKSCLAPERLVLKIGAEIMFTKNNFEAGYVNGTQGIIVDFDVLGEPVVEIAKTGKKISVSAAEWQIEEDGKVKAKIVQYPLRLAWAITIHKSQGMSLDSAEIDLSKTFAYGMGYVALSRVRTLSGVRLVGFDKKALEVDPLVFDIDNNLKNESQKNEELFNKLTKDAQEKLENEFVLKMGGKIFFKNFSTPKNRKSPKSVSKSKKEPNKEWTEKMTKIRAEFPNAGKKWASEDDKRLLDLFNKKTNLKKISKELGRNENSINLRLVSKGLMEPTEEMQKFLDRQKESRKKVTE